MVVILFVAFTNNYRIDSILYSDFIFSPVVMLSTSAEFDENIFFVSAASILTAIGRFNSDYFSCNGGDSGAVLAMLRRGKSIISAVSSPSSSSSFSSKSMEC